MAMNKQTTRNQGISEGKPMSDLEAIQQLQTAYQSLRTEISKVIIGQENVLEQLFTCVFAKGHSLLIGVPGLAKTLIVRALAQTLSLSFNRIQFTPDLMPSDITGTEVIQEDRSTGQRCFQFIKGPVFANIILADEINRTPPKTQAALLEAMQELQVTAGGKKYPLTQPFFVLATQNPIEQEGTYPLPEAQLDRFMFNILIDYPSPEEELEIMKLTTSISPFEIKLDHVLSTEEILRLQEIVKRVPISDHVMAYAMTLARQSRVHAGGVPEFIKEWVAWGAGPRASLYMMITAKARAILHGRYYVSIEDIQSVAYPVLRHRIITNFSAEAEGVTTNKIIDKLIEITPTDENTLIKNTKLPKVIASSDSSK